MDFCATGWSPDVPSPWQKRKAPTVKAHRLDTELPRYFIESSPWNGSVDLQTRVTDAFPSIEMSY